MEQNKLNIPEVNSRCPTCYQPNPSLVNCKKCNNPTMCTMCESAGICSVCRELVKQGRMKIEKEEKKESSGVSDEERNEAMKTSFDVLKKLHGAVPVLVPPLKALTKLSEEDFDELLTTIRNG